MGLDLTNQYVSSSFKNLLQISGSDQVTDGTGSLITELDITASHAVTASYAENAEAWDGQFSGSAGITGSLTVDGDSLFGSTPIVIQGASGIEPGYIRNATYKGLSGDPRMTIAGPNVDFNLTGSATAEFEVLINGGSRFKMRDTGANMNVPLFINAGATGSLFGTSSYATTASYAENANVDSGSWDGQYSGSAGITGSLTIPIDINGDFFQQGIFLTSSIAQAWLNDRSLTIDGVNATLVLRGDQAASIILDSDTDSYIQKQGGGNFYFDNNAGDTILEGSGSVIVNQPLEANGGITGSLRGNADTATTASHAIYAETTGTAINSTYAQNTITTGKSLEGSPILKGTPLYFTGSGTNGNLVGVYLADAGNPDRMPAGGVAGEDIDPGEEGLVLLDGYIGGVDTSAFAAGDEVFVGVGGGYTNVAPTGSTNLIQHLGNVEKSHQNNGSGVIQMMGEPRGLPNIAEGNIWVGDANDVPQPIATSSLTVALADNLTPGAKTHDGVITQTVPMPALFGETDFYTVTGANAGVYHVGLQDYTGFGVKFAHQGYMSEQFDSLGFNYGTAIGNSLTGVGFFMITSGSGEQVGLLTEQVEGQNKTTTDLSGHALTLRGLDTANITAPFVNITGDTTSTGTLTLQQVTGSGAPLTVESAYFTGSKMVWDFFNSDVIDQGSVSFLTENTRYNSTGNMYFDTNLGGENKVLDFTSHIVNFNGSGSGDGTGYININANNNVFITAPFTTVNGNSTVEGGTLTVNNQSDNPAYLARFGGKDTGGNFEYILDIANDGGGAFGIANATVNGTLQVNQSGNFREGAVINGDPIAEPGVGLIVSDGQGPPRLEIPNLTLAGIVGHNVGLYGKVKVLDSVGPPGGAPASLEVKGDTQITGSLGVAGQDIRFDSNKFTVSDQTGLDFVSEANVTFESKANDIQFLGDSDFSGSVEINGQTTIVGNGTRQGYETQQFAGGAVDTQYKFLEVTGASIDGDPYNNYQSGFQNYPSFGNQYKDGMYTEIFDSFGYNYGIEQTMTGQRWDITLAPSGSGWAASGNLSMRDNQFTGKSLFTMYASEVQIGGFRGETITIGNHNQVAGRNTETLTTRANQHSTLVYGTTGAYTLAYENPTGGDPASFIVGQDSNASGSSSAFLNATNIQLNTLNTPGDNYVRIGSQDYTQEITLEASGSIGLQSANSNVSIEGQAIQITSDVVTTFQGSPLNINSTYVGINNAGINQTNSGVSNNFKGDTTFEGEVVFEGGGSFGQVNIGVGDIVAGTGSIDLSLAQQHWVNQIPGETHIEVTNGGAGRKTDVLLFQSSTGSLWTFDPNINWIGGSAPSIPVGNFRQDLIRINSYYGGDVRAEYIGTY